MTCYDGNDVLNNIRCEIETLEGYSISISRVRNTKFNHADAVGALLFSAAPRAFQCLAPQQLIIAAIDHHARKVFKVN